MPLFSKKGKAREEDDPRVRRPALDLSNPPSEGRKG